MDNEYITINEASKLTGKCQNTIHRYIKKGKLHVNTCQYNGKQVITVKKSELERVFNIPVNTCHDRSSQMESHVNTGNDMSIHGNTGVTKEEIKEVIQEFFTSKQSELMKPIEEMSLYKLGAVEKENVFLRERLETMRQENELLREQVKALPDLQTIQEKEKDLIIQIEMERKEKEDLLSRGETIRQEQEEKHRKELEARQKEQEELKKSMEEARQELTQARKQTEEEGKNYLATIEELKKRLEAEEKKPWYRRLFS